MLRIGSIRGIAIYWHFSSVLGLLIFSRFRIAPWSWLAFLGLVLVHELGHAALVRWRGHRVVGVHFTAWGGECQWRPSARASATGADRVIIAWGGVLAQAIVLACALVLVRVGQVRHPFVDALVWSNGFMIFFNLMPIPPLDGATAWRLGELRGRSREPREAVPPEVKKLMKDLKKRLR